MLEYVGIADVANARVRLPFGTLKRVGLAGASSRNRGSLLDEPAGGLEFAEEVSALGAFITKLRDDFDLTVLFVGAGRRAA